jgi:transposase-like protein
MITERTLRKWRREALETLQGTESIRNIYEGTAAGLAKEYIETQQRVLRMTQELLDQHLLRKEIR